MERRSEISRVVAAAAVVAGVLIGTGGAAQASSAVPAELAPPEGHFLHSVYRAEGVQVYGCTDSAWTFIEPAATLDGRIRGERGRVGAIHFRGPTWQSLKDGSSVEARAVANSPVDGAIPQLLLEATKNRGGSAFGAISYIQRIETVGGLAPARECADGELAGVPYEATYRFFAPESLPEEPQ